MSWSCLPSDAAGKAIERARWRVERPAFEADAEAAAEPVINPVDLGAILPPADWLVLGPKQQASVTVAAFSSKEAIPGAQVTAWFESAADRPTKTAVELRKGVRAELKLALPSPAFTKDRDTVHVAIRDAKGRELWHKTIRAMLVREAPKLPAFGAIETKLRYDYPLLSYSGPNEVTEIPYDQAWAPERKDVVVALPNGSRFVFWRGAAYTPFWAGKHNTALNFEFAEAPRRRDGVDCVDASSDKELRRSRVEIIESTAARVHVRWTAQPCDLNYKVWGESVAEDFYFYPDGFGTRTMTLQCEPKAQYEIEELLILTPPAAYPLRVLPENLVDVLFRDGTKRELKFPILDQERDYEKLLSGDMPPLYRIRFSARDTASADLFQPRLDAPARDGFTARSTARARWSRPSTGAIISRSPAQAHRPQHRRPRLHDACAQRDDVLGPPPPAAAGKPRGRHARRARRHAEDAGREMGLAHRPQRRRRRASARMVPQLHHATESRSRPAHGCNRPPTTPNAAPRCSPSRNRTSPSRSTPTTPCVHPVFELHQAPKTLARVELNRRPLPANDYAWDGRTLWLNATLREKTSLRLVFGDHHQR